jgi:hypothetical protein
MIMRERFWSDRVSNFTSGIIDLLVMISINMEV